MALRLHFKFDANKNVKAYTDDYKLLSKVGCDILFKISDTKFIG